MCSTFQNLVLLVAQRTIHKYKEPGNWRTPTQVKGFSLAPRKTGKPARGRLWDEGGNRCKWIPHAVRLLSESDGFTIEDCALDRIGAHPTDSLRRYLLLLGDREHISHPQPSSNVEPPGDCAFGWQGFTRVILGCWCQGLWRQLVPAYIMRMGLVP